jgi:hypothetical protein
VSPTAFLVGHPHETVRDTATEQVYTIRWFPAYRLTEALLSDLRGSLPTVKELEATLEAADLEG